MTCTTFAGMKLWPVVILVLMTVLGAVVPGCKRVPRYDGRLTALDSLMRGNPDSVVAVLEALTADSFASEGDHAYRDLLLTQARYKAYITATSDSDINRALAYFSAHPSDLEKLTRAYIYKGAVMDELGHPDSAMLYYKTAEATAAPDDYFNLGYAKMRMGALYNNHYSMDGNDALKYEEALECFRLAKDSVSILTCLNNLGCIYRETNPKKAESLLQEALMTAKQLYDTIGIVYNCMSLAEWDYCLGRYVEAQKIIREASGYGIGFIDYQMYFTAANVYAKLGILDSAALFFDMANQYSSGDDALFDVYRLEALSELALAEKDSLLSLKLDKESTRIEDSLISNTKKIQTLHSEEHYDKQSLRQHKQTHDKTVSSNQWLVSIIAAVMSITAILAFLYYRRIHQYDRLIKELKQENECQLIDLKTLQQNVNKLKINDFELKEFILSHIDMMRMVIEECYHLPHNPLTKEIRKIISFHDKNTSNWKKLYNYLDLDCNNIMSETKERFPQLSDKDLLIIALTCLGFSCAQIAMVIDYSSSAGISTIRKRIAAKMGIDCLLGEYIEQYKSKH